MKIISIKFLNLNSLKGQHEIRFDRAPFTESGLFAITGATGAGKTTILDAITVALYGRVHRHSKDVFEMMTRHTAESYAEVEFEVKDQMYRAKWSIRRSRGKADGQLQTQKMELADALTGKIIIEHPLQEVRDEIVRRCGLDYSQFLRSVMLSQGDFTRFLKADENERSELLEKITDTGIYSQISVAAYEKARKERMVLDQLHDKLNDTPLLNEEERLAYTAELDGLAAQEMLSKQLEAGLRTKLDWLSNLEKLEHRKLELLGSLETDELFYTAHLESFKKLRLHQQALIYRPNLAELETIAGQLLQMEDAWQKNELLLPVCIQEEEITKTTLTAAKDQAGLTQNNLNLHEPVFERVIEEDVLIDQAGSQLAQIQKLTETAGLNLNAALAADVLLSAGLKSIRERITVLEKWLADNAKDAELDKEVIVFRQQVRELEALETKISAIKNTQADYKNQLAEERVSVERRAENITVLEQKLQVHTDTVEALGTQLKSVLADRAVEELELELAAFPPLISTAEQQIRLANLYRKLQADQAMAATELQEYGQNHVLTQTAVGALTKEHELAAAVLDDLQKIYDLEVKVQNYDADRLQLEPEQPCPLCGAVHHPYAEGKYTGRVTEAAQRRSLQQEKMQEIKTRLDQQLMGFHTLTYQLQSVEKTLVQLETAVKDVLTEFEERNKSLPKPLEITRPEIIVAVVEKKKVQEQTLRQQLKSVRDLQLQMSTMESSVHQQKEVLTAERSKAEQAALTIAFAEKQLAAAVLELQTAELERKALQFAAMQLLTPFNLIYDAGNTSLTVQEMDNRYTLYNQSVKELNQLQPELRQKETELKSSGLSISEKKDTLEQFSAQLKAAEKELQQMQENRFELFGIKDPKREREQLQTELKKYTAQTEALQRLLQEKQEKVRITEDRQTTLNTTMISVKKQYETKMEQLIAKINEIGLPSVAALNLLFMPEEEAAAAERLEKEAAQKIASGKSLLAATEKDLEEEKKKVLTDELKEILVQQLEEQSTALSLLQQQKGKLRQVLDEDDLLKIKYKEVAQQLERQQKEFERFQKLSALIGSADGKKFSRFAQGLTLARLTELANRHLLRLSDRYSILKSPEKDLDLQIIDGYQADVVRPMSTLSGGESFLVSLALALGLSDLASRKVQINSLFIDEGFGTLDAETLDVAITALENLQVNGKSIGIISHVEALKERIGTQIQVIRQPGGSSKITLCSYGSPVI